jgi:hypothetical protein
VNAKVTVKNLKTGKVTYRIMRQMAHDPKIVVGKRLSNWEVVTAVEEAK